MSPVDISNVRYVRSLFGSPNARAVGHTPTPFARSFTANNDRITPAPVTSAGAEMSVPARRKKKGVSNAKQIDRIRSIRTRSCTKIPAMTSPAMYAGSTASLPADTARAPSPKRTIRRNLISGSLTRDSSIG